MICIYTFDRYDTNVDVFPNGKHIIYNIYTYIFVHCLHNVKLADMPIYLYL